MADQHPFALGWVPESAAKARARMVASGRYCTVLPSVMAPLPAVSLSRFLLRAMTQGQAGTCWDHAGVCLSETLAASLGYEAFPICRRLVGWEGKQLEGGGNPSDGGSATDALYSMTQEKGVGIAHEDLCPYTDDRRTLGSKPPANVYEDAKKSHLVAIVDVRSNDDMRRLISQGYPVANGTWWPFNFDDQQTFMTTIGHGTYGHALTKIGYVMPGVWPGEHGKYGWQQWRNWHGQLYPPLPADLAALVPGYRSDSAERTSDFWVREDLDLNLQQRGNYEHVSATDFTGLGRVVTVPSFLGTFPI